MTEVPYIGDIISPFFDETGYPKPVVEYQWIRDGDDISGASRL